MSRLRHFLSTSWRIVRASELLSVPLIPVSPHHVEAEACQTEKAEDAGTSPHGQSLGWVVCLLRSLHFAEETLDLSSLVCALRRRLLRVAAVAASIGRNVLPHLLGDLGPIIVIIGAEIAAPCESTSHGFLKVSDRIFLVSNQRLPL